MTHIHDGSEAQRPAAPTLDSPGVPALRTVEAAGSVAARSTAQGLTLPMYDPEAHYGASRGPTTEFGEAVECEPTIRNVGWTLGNDCPYRCKHCYSMSARRKGRNMSRSMIDRVIQQLAANQIETVNLGGNEPLFTNGPKAADTLLPYIVDGLVAHGIEVGLTTSGITLNWLEKHRPETVALLNDVDVSLDSPFENEHNANRGARLFHQALDALAICRERGIPRTVVMCGMSWNFSRRHLEALIDIAREHGANVRINPLKPVEPAHMSAALAVEQYYEGFAFLMERCRPVDLGEGPIAAVSRFQHARRCPCGRTSFRIHSVTPDGAIHVSPCVYLHDYKSTLDLVRHDLSWIIDSPEFRVFRQRNANPNLVTGCDGCEFLMSCGGGCAARAYLHRAHDHGSKSFLARDPYCPVEANTSHEFPDRPEIDTSQKLVHMDYLCTWIGTPR